MSLCAEVKKEAEEGDEPRAETESESEEELSCFAPTVRNEKWVFTKLLPVYASSFGSSAQPQPTASDPMSRPFSYFSRNVGGRVTSIAAFQRDCLTPQPLATCSLSLLDDTLGMRLRRRSEGIQIDGGNY